MHLLRLPREDVLFPLVLAQLSIPSLFLLRGTCRALRAAVDQYLGRLRELDLAGNNRISREAVQVLADHVAGLTRLDLSDCAWTSDELVRPMIAGSPRMRSVRLSGSQGLDNPVIQTIAVTCKGLTELSLRDCHWLSPPAVQVLNLHLRHLTHLHLAGCWGVADSVLAEVFSEQPQ